MSDPLGRDSNYPRLSTDLNLMHADSTSVSNIPVSDFRRDEIRPIITDDGI